MKCAKVDCCWDEIIETAPCCVCGRFVHHLCSNELCSKADLSKRFCSVKCVNSYFSTDATSQELYPSTTSGISASNQATLIDLVQSELEKKDASELEDKAPSGTGIPERISHGPPRNSTDAVWTVIHELGKPVVYAGKTYTYICLLCAQTKKWQRSLCKTEHATNEKTHLLLRHKTHELAVWNVEQLCQNIDVCRWFRDVGEHDFPSVAKLARVWLGRSSSTAFQERVFSTASFVMSPLRTRTENERAQRQLILRHNCAELQRLEESMHSVW